MGDLNSLSVPLWIMAVVSVLQALLLIGMGVAGYLVYSRVMTLVTDLEARQIAPIREKVDEILADVKGITARVSQQTERVLGPRIRGIQLAHLLGEVLDQWPVTEIFRDDRVTSGHRIAAEPPVRRQ